VFVFVFVVNNLATLTVQCICSCSDGCSKKYRATQCERKHQTKVEHSTTEVWCYSCRSRQWFRPRAL